MSGFLAGKDRGDHICSINELFYSAVTRRQSRILFLMDTAKAFDSIDHDWVHQILQVWFPSWFRHFVKGTLHGVKVAPFFGGDLTDWIDILRGVKQGCPLSPLLFIIAYEPLLFKLSRMEGFSPYAFADDLALFVDSMSTIAPALSLISVFSVVSGLGFNKEKSVALPTAGPLSALPFASS